MDARDSFAALKDEPLARIPGETRRANAALRDYALMGPGRSLRKLQQKYIEDTSRQPPTRHLRILLGWSTRWAWQSRVAEFDRLQHETEIELWEARRRQVHEQDWQTGEQLRQKVAEFLAELSRFTRTQEREVVREDGERVRVVTVALNATLAQIAQAFKTASDLQRLATDEPTSHVELSGAALDAAILRELARVADGGQAGAAGATEDARGDEPAPGGA